MTLKQILVTPHKELDKNQILIKMFYISEFLRIDEVFDNMIKQGISLSLKRGHIPAKAICLEDFNQDELLDYLQPIE